MNNNSEIFEGIYRGTYKSNFPWENIIRKLTVRQAYVFYYSLAYDEKKQHALTLGIYDLPDKTMVHKCLMDALIKKDNASEVAKIIGDNAHTILISDNDLLWVKQELRAALWLSHFVARVDNGGDQILLGLLRSTTGIEFINRLIHVLDIHGCTYKEEKALRIRIDLDNSSTTLVATHLIAFNRYRGEYISNRISDTKLNWLKKLPEDEIDIIIGRFEEEKILALEGTFISINKKDKIEVIKSSLDIQNYIQRNNIFDKEIKPYANQNVGNSIKPTETIDTDTDSPTNKKKDFASCNADEIIDLLKKAHNSREYRKTKSKANNDKNITLNKEAHTILIELSEQLKATPKKIIEALIKGINLKDRDQLSEMDKRISGKRTVKTQSALEETDEPIETDELIEKEPIESEEVVEGLRSKRNLKRQSEALLELKKK